LLKLGSRKVISTACGVSTSLISNMRRVRTRYEKDPEFAQRVARPLMETSWGVMKLALRHDDPDDADLDEAAERLARTLHGRHGNELKRDYVVTAMAFEKYDPMLPRNLVEFYSTRKPPAVSQRAPQTDGELRRQAQQLRMRADAFDAEVARRIEARPDAHKDAEAARQAKYVDDAKRWFPKVPGEPTVAEENPEGYEF
jgi:hypothetical protein